MFKADNSAAFSASERLLREFDRREYFDTLSFTLLPQQKRLGHCLFPIRKTAAGDRLSHKCLLTGAELDFDLLQVTGNGGVTVKEPPTEVYRGSGTPSGMLSPRKGDSRLGGGAEAPALQGRFEKCVVLR